MTRREEIEAEKARLAALGARIERIKKPAKLGPKPEKPAPPASLDVHGVKVLEHDEPIVRCIAEALMADIEEGWETPRMWREAVSTARSALEVFRDERTREGA